MSKKWIKNITEKQLYLIIIISVAVLIIVNQIIAQKYLIKIEEEEYATFVTGQLAVESQRLESLSFRAALDSSYFETLKNRSENWYQSGLDVEETDSRLHLNQADTEAVQLNLNQIHHLRDSLYQLIQSLETQSDLLANLDKIVALENSFNASVEELHVLLETISQNEINNLRNLELFIALISLILLLLEFQFIIRPILEDLRRKKEKLEKLNKSKDRILATVAHDIRAPITGIKGLLGILAQQIEKLNPEDEELIDLCLKSCNKAESLIQELLDISLLESEEYHLNTELIHLEQYLKGVLTQFKPKAEEKNIELRMKIDPKSLETKVDKEQFSRVIENIVGNAIKFTKEGRVELYSREIEDRVVLEIRDTGIGIPDKLKDYIFDKFSRARRLGTHGEGTTGLGMSIVKTIVEKHGGKIWLESEEGEGTVFFITLPKTT